MQTFQFPFYRGFFEIQKGPGTRFQASFSYIFFNKKFSCEIYKLAKFHYQTLFTSKLFSKMCFVFHAQAFDDLMAFEYLKSQNLIISRMKRAFEFDKKHFPCFLSARFQTCITNWQKCSRRNLKAYSKFIFYRPNYSLIVEG